MKGRALTGGWLGGLHENRDIAWEGWMAGSQGTGQERRGMGQDRAWNSPAKRQGSSEGRGSWGEAGPQGAPGQVDSGQPGWE